jgi:hypothetical protein
VQVDSVRVLLLGGLRVWFLADGGRVRHTGMSDVWQLSVVHGQYGGWQSSGMHGQYGLW